MTVRARVGATTVVSNSAGQPVSPRPPTLAIVLRLHNGMTLLVPQQSPELAVSGMNVLADLLRKAPGDRAAAFVSGADVLGSDGVGMTPMFAVDAREIVAASLEPMRMDRHGNYHTRGTMFGTMGVGSDEHADGSEEE